VGGVGNIEEGECTIPLLVLIGGEKGVLGECRGKPVLIPERRIDSGGDVPNFTISSQRAVERGEGGEKRATG